MKRKVFLIIPILLAVILFTDSFAFSDQTTTERILHENKDFINFLDVCITNFGTNKTNDLFKVYQEHFNGEVAFLQSDYKRAFKRFYTSQGYMVKIFEHLVKNVYLEDSKDILDRIAPDIIRSKNSRARLYLTLGYRDRTVAKTHYTVGLASNPKLHSYKLYKYQEAIKMTRRAKRYAFLALFESRKPSMKRDIYMTLLKNERKKGNRFFNRFTDISEDKYIDEIAKTFQEFEKTEPKNENSKTFEKKVEKRVRFRKEKRVARFLQNREFDRAEDIIRKYVDDFNFKKVGAVFTTLTEKKKGYDYTKLTVHLLDNYLRLKGKSVLFSLTKKVKVEDNVKENKNESDKKTELNKKADDSKNNDNTKDKNKD